MTESYRYWKACHTSWFEPARSSNWLIATGFLQKSLTSKLPPLKRLPPPVDRIIDQILPAPLTRAMMTKALQHSSKVVTYQAIITIHYLLKRYLLAEKQIKDKVDFEEATIPAQYQQQDQHQEEKRQGLWSSCLNAVQVEFRHRLPDLQLLVAFLTAKKSCDFLEDSVYRVISSIMHGLPDLWKEQKMDLGRWLTPKFSLIAKPRQYLLLKCLDGMDIKWNSRTRNFFCPLLNGNRW